MKAKILWPLALFAGLNVLLAVTLDPSWAQPETSSQKHVAQQTHSVTTFKIEHVRAETMAMWLQPSAMPTAKQDEGKVGGVLSEFPGLESVVANPKSNEIWAKGTLDSVAKLREIISYLDQPVRTVEVKVRFIEADRGDVADLGMAIVQGSATQVFAAQSEFQDKLQSLIRTKRAKVLHSSQITTVNNSQAKASSIANALAPELEWTATPTIQNDNTITLFFTPQISLNPKRFMTTAVNLKAGDQMAFAMNIAAKERPEILAIVSAQIADE